MKPGYYYCPSLDNIIISNGRIHIMYWDKWYGFIETPPPYEWTEVYKRDDFDVKELIYLGAL